MTAPMETPEPSDPLASAPARPSLVRRIARYPLVQAFTGALMVVPHRPQRPGLVPPQSPAFRWSRRITGGSLVAVGSCWLTLTRVWTAGASFRGGRPTG